MKQIRVEKLIYDFVPPKNVNYENAPALEITQDSWTGVLDNNILTCYVTKEYSSVEDARKIVEEYLQLWEFASCFGSQENRIKFKFKDAEVKEIDFEPAQSDDSVIIEKLGTAFGVGSAHPLKTTLFVNKYPQPPQNGLKITPNVETLQHRYINFLEDKECLTSMAYFCLTLVEVFCGKKRGRRKSAATNLCVDLDVLDTIGELSSTKGDEKTARKFPTKGPMSQNEEAWLKVAIRRLILQLAKYEHAKENNLLDDLQSLAMKDLPELS